MSIQDYLHEKAEESRHNEIIAYMMFLAGSVFFVGGILSSLEASGVDYIIATADAGTCENFARLITQRIS